MSVSCECCELHNFNYIYYIYLHLLQSSFQYVSNPHNLGPLNIKFSALYKIKKIYKICVLIDGVTFNDENPKLFEIELY